MDSKNEINESLSSLSGFKREPSVESVVLHEDDDAMSLDMSGNITNEPKEADSTKRETCSQRRSFLPSETEKIWQSVMVGSVFLALESNFFTPEALLKWLSTADYNERTQIAYKAVCVKINPNDQYLEDTFHFLTKKPQYASIAFGCGLNDLIADQRVENSIDYNPIIAHIQDTLTEFLNKAELRRFSALILAGQGTAQYLESKLATCYRARNFPHLRITANEINIGLVEADWIGKLRYNDELPKLILRRVARLHEEAPIYYAGVAYKAYHNVAVKINKDKLFTQLTRDELATFDSFFPEIIDRKILGYTHLAYKIALLGNDVAGYVLGFPVQNMIPSEEQIHSAIQYLTENGAEAYSKFISQYIETTYLPSSPFPTGDATYSNDQDVMMEDHNNYVPFDVIAYRVGNHIYRFTRPEFDKLVESKKNHWTNEWLPPTVLSSIKSRAEACKELGLPPARPLIEMLERIEKGSLFEQEEGPKTEQRQEIVANPFEMLMAAAMMGGWNAGFPQDSQGGDEEYIEYAQQDNVNFVPMTQLLQQGLGMVPMPSGTVNMSLAGISYLQEENEEFEEMLSDEDDQ